MDSDHNLGEPRPGWQPLVGDSQVSLKGKLTVASAEVLNRSHRKSKPMRAVLAVPPSEILKKDLRLSVADGSAYGVMIGVGETYLQAFVLAIGMGEVFAALLATVPQLIGSLLQLVSPPAIRKLGSHKRWVVVCAGLQALCFVPLILAAWAGEISPMAVMFVASIYWATSLATGPAWNTWQGTIIPRHIRAKFFAKRQRFFQVTTLFGFLVGGYALKAGQFRGSEAPVFALLFAVALISRLMSTFCLMSQSEPFPIPPDMRFLSLKEQWNRFSRGATGRLLVFAVGMQVGVYIAGPFFVPYMLKELDFQYDHFAMLIGVSYLAKFVTLPWWGAVAHRMGAHRLLWIGAVGLVPLAGGWAVSSNYTWLLALQVAAGVAWGAYELALVLLFFETIPESERTSLLTLYNVANSIALVGGSLIGAAILNGLGISVTSYLWVFVGSTVCRGLMLLLLWRIPKPSFDSTEGQKKLLQKGTLAGAPCVWDG